MLRHHVVAYADRDYFAVPDGNVRTVPAVVESAIRRDMGNTLHDQAFHEDMSENVAEEERKIFSVPAKAVQQELGTGRERILFVIEGKTSVFAEEARNIAFFKA